MEGIFFPPSKEKREKEVTVTYEAGEVDGEKVRKKTLCATSLDNLCEKWDRFREKNGLRGDCVRTISER